MRKLFNLIPALMLIMSLNINANAQPLQDFEAVTFPPTGWTLEFTGTQRWTRVAPPGAYNLSTASAKFDYFNAAPGVVQSLITPTLVASTAGDMVTFDQSYHTFETEVDTLYVEASLDNGATYLNVVTLLGGPVVGTGMVTWAASLSSAPPTLASQWATRTYPLPVGTNKIRFRAASAFGNNLYVDNVMTRPVAGQPANDVGITSIIIPLDPIDTKSFIPCASVRNFGTNNQLTPFPVTATIQPGGYSSTVTDTVSAGQTNQVCFAKFIPASDTQTYTITVYTSLGSDGDRSNDTLRITRKFPKSNSGFDPICQYYFANSIAPLGLPLPQPQSRPEYCWKDTTGSINLILNSTNRGTLFGNLDDGHYRLRIKDILLALNQDTTGKRIKHCGTCYDSIFPGTNGVIGLSLADGNGTFLNSFTIDTANAAYNALFPLWRDYNFGVIGTGAGSNRLSVKAKDHQLIITYDKAPSFNNDTMWTSFQTVIEIVKDCEDPNSNFRYTYTDTTTGQSSSTFIRNYFNSFNAALPNATIFFNNFVGITGPSPNSMSIFRGYSSPNNPFPGPNQVDIKRNIYDPATRRALALEYGPDPNVLNLHDCLTLTASVALEGLQRNPQPRVRDTIDIELRDCQSPPYKLMQKARVYLSDSVVAGPRRYGRVSIELSLLKRNFPYYLRIRHRNSIASWSQSVITLTGDTLSYDFTSALTQIFGNNGVLVNGNASFYSGDINQDGIVDGSDLLAVDNDAFNFVQGDYVITDLNWDGIVDGSDAAIADNNAANFVTEVAPPGFVGDDSYAELPTYDYNYNESEIIVIPDLYAKPKTDTDISEQKSRKQ